jgi:hypothetical protein
MADQSQEAPAEELPDVPAPGKKDFEKTLIERKKTRIELGQLVTAVCSVFIAGISLWLAMSSLRSARDQQKEDLERQELLISPNLFMRISDDGLKLVLLNSGLGPARITRIAVAIGDDCIDSAVKKPSDWDREADRIRNEIKDAAESNLMENIRKSGSAFSNASLVSIGELIPMGGGVPLVELRVNLPPDASLIVPVIQQFRKNIDQVQFEIGYESLTGIPKPAVNRGQPKCKK